MERSIPPLPQFTPDRPFGRCEDSPERAQREEGNAEALFAMAFEDAPIGVAIVLPDGCYLDANPALCELLGRSRGELRRLTWRDVTHPDDLAADQSAIAELAAAGGRRITLEKRFVHRDGTSRHVRLNASVLRDEHGAEQYSIVQVEDVTAAHRFAKALSAAEEHFRLTFDRAPLGMAIIDLEGRLADVNEALCTMVGRERKALLGAPAGRLGFATETSAVLAAPTRSAAGPAPADHTERSETLLQGDDGSLTWVAITSYLVADADGTPLHRFAQFNDVTEQRRAEEALRQSERRFATMFESAPIGMSLNALDGTRLAVNAALAELTGYTTEELLGTAYGSLALPEDGARVTPLTDRLFAGELDDYSLEARLVRKDGRAVPVEIVTSLIRDGQGAPLYVMGQIAEAGARQTLERQQQQASRLEAMGRLAGGVAHDFNNLLLVVRGYSHLLLQRLPEGDPARADALEIDSAAERAAQLVGQLLAIGRRQLLQPRALALNEIILKAESLVRGLTLDALELRLSLAPGIEPVRADPAQLEQAIVALVINSCDATPAGGVITIATSSVRLAKPAAAGLGLAPGRYALLEVADTGRGMDAFTAARAFEPFFTTKPEGAGSGLGLASVHGAITQAGGGVALESSPGAGTTVRLYLPLASSAAVPGHAVPAARPAPGRTVLVIEEDSRSRALFTRTIRGGGLTAIAFASPVEALSWLDVSGNGVDVVVVAAGLPGSDAATLARRLLELRPEAGVVLISSDAGGRAGSPGERGVRLLARPFTTGALLAEIEACLGERASAT